MTKILIIVFALMFISGDSQPKYKLTYEDEMRVLNNQIEMYKQNVKWAQYKMKMVIKQSQ